MKNFWISWEHREEYSGFELHTPWWITGSGESYQTVCAAVRAEDEEGAKKVVLDSFDETPQTDDFQWRFVQERPADWSPFSERFPKQKWMQW